MSPLGLSLALVALVFAIDLALPLGVASAVPYTFAVLLALSDRRSKAGPAVAAVCAVLTVLKMFIHPDRGTTEEWKVLANRGLALFAIGLTTVLGILRKRATAAREAAEEQLKAQRETLAHVGRLSMLGQVAAGLAHELNQPLAAIGLQAEVAARLAERYPDAGVELSAALKEIAAQSSRAGEIIRGVRRMARKESPGSDPLPVDDAVASALAILDWQIKKAHAVVRIDPGGPGAVVAANRIQIEQVLLNLLQNALDAVAGQPLDRRIIEVGVGISQESVVVTVLDSGEGGYDAARLFEPFYTTKAGGLGLGLAICRGIVEAHGGRLAAQRTDGGTEFAMTLPVLPSEAR
jgi:C4-dicarboxylate-specific signal transduction histidine kinase